jgi:multifunctional 2-oxoglutarate metabolism enzyme
LETVVDALTRAPAGFTVHPKVARLLEARRKLWASGQVDWALGEALAFGTIVLDGRDVRLCGQDTRRGTFGHRNAVYVDYRTGAEDIPLADLAREHGDSAGRFFVYDSLLSEYAALGFEYGYTLFSPDGLVAWEAQFGDFVNAAQVVIDQFLAASEVKWDQPSDLVLLLPHGYEGQGPEHSSARVERFLELCAEDNMCVANVTTAAQLFHILRRQVFQPFKKPLVLFTPKRYLRGREAYSPVEDLAAGAFREVIDDSLPPEEVRRVVLATGKVALDLLVAREDRGANDVAIVRVEQLYPWPGEQIAAALSRYGRAVDVVWAQEEPANMGAWEFARERLGDIVPVRQRLTLVSRPPSGSPATGSHTMHELEQADVVERALGN